MTGNYDRIARFYEVDMARNMRFDDVGFYTALCARRGGRVLELGCGTGRILLPLLAAGVDAVGVDASAGMLAELTRAAAAQGLPAPVCRMDVRALAFAPGFSTILCPYSLVTYLNAPGDVDGLFAAARTLLAPGGRFVVDAFVPRPVRATIDWQQDYVRPFGDGFLVRSKRIVPLSSELNRIERRYEVQDADGVPRETIAVSETIRPVTPEELASRLIGAGFALERTVWDYAAVPSPSPESSAWPESPESSASPVSSAQFVAYIARRAEA